MDTVVESRPARALSALLAGLQAGMLGVLAMLLYLGVDSAWHRRTFWTAENLMASSFYGNSAIRSGFSDSTAYGIALYLVCYASIGSLFALVLRDKVSGLRLTLFAVVFSLGWYYLAFHWVWGIWSPLVGLLHPERPTLFGHLLYGVLLARYPRYLTPSGSPVSEPPQEALHQVERGLPET